MRPGQTLSPRWASVCSAGNGDRGHPTLRVFRGLVRTRSQQGSGSWEMRARGRRNPSRSGSALEPGWGQGKGEAGSPGHKRFPGRGRAELSLWAGERLPGHSRFFQMKLRRKRRGPSGILRLPTPFRHLGYSRLLRAARLRWEIEQLIMNLQRRNRPKGPDLKARTLGCSRLHLGPR